MPTVSSASWFPTDLVPGAGARLRRLASRTSLPAFLAAGALLPFVAGDYWTFNVTVGLILAVSCLGLQVLTGWTGQISLMQAGLTGMALVLNRRLLISDGWSPTAGLRHHYLFSATVTVAATTAVSVAVGALSARRPLLYPIVATFAVQFLLVEGPLLESWWYGGLSEASMPRQFLNLDLETDRSYYWYTFAALLVVLAGVHRLRHSRYGRAMIAVGNDPVSAAVQGISPVRARVGAFAVAGVTAGLAGVLSASLYRGMPGILSYTSTQSVVYLAVVVIAGTRSRLGLVVVAVALTAVPASRLSIDHGIPLPLVAGVLMLLVLGARGLRGRGPKVRPSAARVPVVRVPDLAAPIDALRAAGCRRLASFEGLAVLSVASLVFDTAAVVRHERGWLPAGVTEYGLSGPVGVSAITTGPDGNLWFTEARRIGRITPTGQVTEFDDPPGVGESYVRIVAAREGLLATESDGVSRRISTTGTATDRRPGPEGLAATAPDGAVWSVDQQAKRITRAPSAGPPTWYEGFLGDFAPDGMAADRDGNLWLSGVLDARIWRLTRSGQVASFAGLPQGAQPRDLALGPDGNMWFHYAPHRLGRITPTGVITGYRIPGPDLGGLTAGPDGNLWFTAQTVGYYPSRGKIGRIEIAKLRGYTFEYVAPTNWSAVVIAAEQRK